MNPLPKVSFPLAVVVLLALHGCGSDSTTSPPPTANVEAVTQTSISGIVGAAASPAPVVRVSDSNTHQPLPNIPVEFRVVTGGGSIANNRVVTDAKGQASPGEWRFGTLPG